jgi:sarcosine oxidase/L-pipecolate oxidase
MAFVNSIQLQPIWSPTLILLCPLFYFDLRSAFDIVPNNILLHKLSNFGLSSSYVDWFHSYLDNRHSSVRISGTLSFSFLVKSGVPQDSALGSLLFNIFINDICSYIYSRYLLFADDLKIYHTIINVDDCKLLQHDINSVHN